MIGMAYGIILKRKRILTWISWFLFCHIDSNYLWNLKWQSSWFGRHLQRIFQRINIWTWMDIWTWLGWRMESSSKEREFSLEFPSFFFCRIDSNYLWNLKWQSSWLSHTGKLSEGDKSWANGIKHVCMYYVELAMPHHIMFVLNYKPCHYYSYWRDAI